MNRRQVLIGSGAICLAGTSALIPGGSARAALSRDSQPGNFRPRDALPGNLPSTTLPHMSVELGGIIRGSYQLRTVSVAHRTV